MDSLVLIATVLLATGVGIRLIHLRNAQHDVRLAACHFSDALPGVGRRSRRTHLGPAPGDGGPADRTRAAR
ncbi:MULTISPECIES: hypothetical protein [unclassified Streptomyces]|uniref:hypothetical protein n=1 Tax=unclassified Streptomyces TaxID=2593676 RepID=UPI001BE52BC6|nr:MULTISPECIES: hypothetical protein [unclassified Streptomyces]MBT2408278.1 hypothetical protein [Streptomyces sp. ISL-21]MBT2457705.1 hypothetical protein [Streptomyces sp. ISL-86]MBT2607346.1 hypothetical protein [Streptomyces sp. ISL-87]